MYQKKDAQEPMSFYEKLTR